MKVARLLTTAVLATAAVVVVAQGASNTLTVAEKQAGWTLLFDGKTTAGWRGFHSATFPESGWVVENGTIKTVGQGPSGGDIITVDQFDHFELRLEWKIGPGGNTGVKYLISEDLIKTGRSGSASRCRSSTTIAIPTRWRGTKAITPPALSTI